VFQFSEFTVEHMKNLNDMNKTNRKSKKKGLEKYEKTIVLLSILLVVFSLLFFIPLKNKKHTVNKIAVDSKLPVPGP